MATTYEGTIPSLLQGVSQQIPRERQEGQLGAQVNMLSDPVTGLRRRPPARDVGVTSMDAPADDALFTAYIERGTDGRHLLINTQTGAWQLLSKDTGTLKNSGQSNYLKATIGATSIQTASIAGLTYILNTEQYPQAVVDNTGKQNPANTGFFVATTAAFNKYWTIQVYANGQQWGATYPAPAEGPEEARASAVVQALATSLVNNGYPYEVYVSNNTLFFRGPNLTVSSDAGSTYSIVSNQSRVNQESDLPAQLPAVADGMMCRVGQAGADATWYRFDYADRTWREDGAYGSVSKITNMPLELAADDNIIVRDFEGRLAGDEETNPDPAFVENGYITGIAAFQGRLVLLSGASVCMSASSLYQRFYRSTVTSLLDSDRISIAAASAQDSVFRTAIQFNRDLVVFGDSMQAVVPGGQAVTPTSASISLTSEFSCDSRIAPIATGQTLLYANRRNSNYAGLLEFIPSAYTSSQYVSQDATVHLPRYIPGRIMGMHVSSVTNIGFVRYSGERDTLLVYEYLWGPDSQKVQAAYHKWVMPLQILSLHSQSEIMYLFVKGAQNKVQVLLIDPREGFVANGDYEYPYLDLMQTVTVTDGMTNVPLPLRRPGLKLEDIALAYKEDASAAGSELGLNSLPFTAQDNWNCWTVRGVPDGEYYLGFRTKASFTLTPPMMKDQNDNLVGSGHVRLLRLDAAVRNSGVFDIAVVDRARDVDNEMTGSGVLMNSKELAPGLPLKTELANIIIPCRTNADTTDVTLSTSGTQEMNVLDVTYILRYNQRRRRI